MRIFGIYFYFYISNVVFRADSDFVHDSPSRGNFDFRFFSITQSVVIAQFRMELYNMMALRLKNSSHTKHLASGDHLMHGPAARRRICVVTGRSGQHK